MADRAMLGVLEVARSVLAELDLETVLERVLRAAQELTGAEYAALGVLGESRRDLSRFLTVGVDDEMRADAVADQRDGLNHLAHPDQPDIRTAEPRIGDAGAGNVKRLEARPLGDERGQCVVDAGRDHNRRPGKAKRQRLCIHARNS